MKSEIESAKKCRNINIWKLFFVFVIGMSYILLNCQKKNFFFKKLIFKRFSNFCVIKYFYFLREIN